MEKIFTTYGAFATMLFGLIAYFINRFYNYKSKKAELDYSFFQEHKIKAIIKFFDCYGKSERMWHHFPIYRLLNKQINETDLDSMIWPLMNSLYTSICELTLYMDQNEIEPFKKINERLLDLNGIILDIYTSHDEENTILRGNRFHLDQKKVLKDCQILLQQIGNNTRLSFLK